MTTVNLSNDKKRENVKANDGQQYVYVVESSKGANLRNVDKDTVKLEGNAADYSIKATAAGVIITSDDKQFKVVATLQRVNERKELATGELTIEFADGKTLVVERGAEKGQFGKVFLVGADGAKEELSKQGVDADDLFPTDAPTEEPAGALTAKLNELAEAEQGVADALEAAALAVNAAEETPREGETLTEFVAEFDADALAQAVKDAEADITAKADAVEAAEGELSTARGTNFGNELDAAFETGDAYTADYDGAFDSKGVALTGTQYDLGLKDTNIMTDANIAKAVAEAQKAVNADKAMYLADGSLATETDVNDTDVFTAKALQNKAAAAASALSAHESANGTNAELLAALRTATTNLLNAGVGVDTEILSGAFTLTIGDAADGTTLTDLLTGLNTALAADADADAADELVSFFFDAGDGVLSDINTGNTALDKAFNDIVAKLEKRDELTEVSGNANDNFEATVTGGLLDAVKALQTAREEALEKVADAQAELTEAQTLETSLKQLQADYDTAADALAAVEKYFADNGLTVEAVDGALTASEKADVFVFVEKEGTIEGFGLEGDDQLFLGESFTRVDLAADAKLTDRLGDAATLEVFFQQEGNNTVVYVEKEAFAGSAASDADLVKITLTGVNAADLALSADGFITLA